MLGVEAGGSSTVCMALDYRTYQVQARAVSGSSSWAAVGRSQAQDEIWTAIRSCIQKINKDLSDVYAVCVCITGMELPEDVEFVSNAFKDLSEGQGLFVYSDAVTWLASGNGAVLHGCVVLSGPGTVAFGMVDGKVQARASGWGPAFMDGGSAYDIGARALGAVSKAQDDRGASTKLVDAVFTHLQMSNKEELIRWARTDPIWPKVAELAPVVMECATQGDAVAETILRHGVGELFRSIKAVVHKLGLDKMGQGFKLVFAGSLLPEGCLYAQYLSEVIKENIPNAEICYPAYELSESAARLAYNDLHNSAHEWPPSNSA